MDQDSGVLLDRVQVILEINERNFVPFIGPEGTTRPRIRQDAGAYTDANGLFYIDLRKVKEQINAAYPGEKLVMGSLAAYKGGYLNLHEIYTGPGQTLRLKKR